MIIDLEANGLPMRDFLAYSTALSYSRNGKITERTWAKKGLVSFFHVRSGLISFSLSWSLEQARNFCVTCCDYVSLRSRLFQREAHDSFRRDTVLPSDPLSHFFMLFVTPQSFVRFSCLHKGNATATQAKAPRLASPR